MEEDKKTTMADTVDAKRVKEYDEEDTDDFESKLDTLAKMVKKSKYTVFFTGAGVSTSAGVGGMCLSLSFAFSFFLCFVWLIWLLRF